MVRFHVAREERRHAESNSPAAHFGETDGTATAIRFVGEIMLARADLVDGPREVAIPFHGVHGEIEMGVDDEHAGNPDWGKQIQNDRTDQTDPSNPSDQS
jgi:hypothetical protein